jgi:hypothetical protein
LPGTLHNWQPLTTYLVIGTALGLIDKELQKLHINIRESADPNTQSVPSAIPQSPQARSPIDSMQTSAYTVPPPGAFSITPPPNASEAQARHSPPQQQQQQQQQQIPELHIPYDPFSLDPSLPTASSFSQQGIYDIAPELFEAFSYTEPMPTNVGSGFDTSWATFGGTENTKEGFDNV